METKYDDTQLGYKRGADELAEIVKQFYPDVEVVKGEDRCTFHVYLSTGGQVYRVNKDYRGNITVNRKDWGIYQGISSHKRAEVYKLDTTQNMRVVTAKKLKAKIEAEEAYHAEMARLEKENARKIADFRASVEDLGLEWCRDNTEGRVIKNGIEYKAVIHDDGYISEKVSIYYSVDNTADRFRQISDNKYKA